LETLQPCFHGRAEASVGRQAVASGKQLDVATRLREMW
jgi:hypothetical protein